MKSWETEQQAREEIKALVADYYHQFKEKKEAFHPGDRINYGGRVFDEREMATMLIALKVNLPRCLG